jgi:hypothetical protein
MFNDPTKAEWAMAPTFETLEGVPAVFVSHGKYQVLGESDFLIEVGS